MDKDEIDFGLPKVNKYSTGTIQYSGPCPDCKKRIKSVSVSNGEVTCPECKSKLKV